MPTYQYACTVCDERLEVVQKFSDEPLTVCDACGGKLRKLFSAVGIVFKGSGFYRTDSRNGSVPGGSKDKSSNGSASGTESGSGTGSPGEKKASDSSGSGPGPSGSGSSGPGSSGSGSSGPGSAGSGKGSSGGKASAGSKVA